MSEKPLDNQGAPEEESAGGADEARRAALKRLGIFTAYTAPAMLMLLHGKASAQSVSSGSTL